LQIGSRIKAIRKERGITQTDLALKAGISRTYLADLEGNRTATRTITKDRTRHATRCRHRHRNVSGNRYGNRHSYTNHVETF